MSMLNRAILKLQTLALVSVFFIAPVSGADSKAVFLRQTHFFFGEFAVTFTEKAIRMENVGSFRFILVSRAPKWQVDVFRTDDKVYFSEPLKDLEDTGLASGFLLGFRDRIPRDIVRKPREFLFHNMPAMRSQTPYSQYEYLKLGSYAPEIEKIFFAAYKTPTCGGIPLLIEQRSYGKDWMTGKDDNGSVKAKLRTTTFALRTVSADIFELPSGYKKAPSLREVVSGSNSRKESEEFQNLFDK